MLKLVNIKKSYQTKDFIQHALNGVSISFRENEFASILGASGSGKTTMLNIIGGLDQYDEGDLVIDGVSTRDYKEKNWDTYRNNRVGFVFQSYNLIPHQSVLSNVELALTLSGVSKGERKEKAIEALDKVGLKDHIYKRPTQLSGGQMQRVAIARALINDPEIVLADDPTGALDSETSKQVMDLLKEIAEDRLVIMVTHNPELAYEYANRIIELKDGEVIGDSNPYESQELERTAQKIKRRSMSFLTAISLSISNLMTKKARTLITALAGSIGIIGIASILALASGINLYIEDIEQETMSAYPLTIDSSGIDITSFMMGTQDMFKLDDVKEGEVPIINSLDSLFTHQNENDLKSLKAYIQKYPDKINPYVKNIQYKYGITPEIFLEDEGLAYAQVNPDAIFKRHGIGDASGFEMVSGGSEMGMRSFSELPGHVSSLEAQYDLVKGKWPTKKEEALVVLMDNGALSDMTMYAMGLKDRQELDTLLEGLMNQESVSFEDIESHVAYDEILNKKFKVILPHEKYEFDEAHNFWLDKSNDKKHMEKTIENGMDLEIVGIIQLNESTKTPMLNSGIYFTEDLIPYLLKETEQSEIVKAQLDKPKVNVFTGETFEEGAVSDMSELSSFEEMIEIDQNKIQNAIQMKELEIEPLDLAFDFESLELPEFDVENLIKILSPQIQVSEDRIAKIFEDAMTDFFEDIKDKEFESTESLIAYLTEFIAQNVQEDLEKEFVDSDNAQEMAESVSLILSGYMQESMVLMTEQISNEINTQIESMASQFSNFEDLVSFDEAMFKESFSFNLEEEDLFSLIQSLAMRSTTSYTSNLKALGYRDINDPTQINLYPKDFSTKDNVIEFIDDYNARMEKENMNTKVVKYTDFVGAMMSSVTSIINMISYALIAFVGISLVVSSIMIGVITYVSVLERIKEIGILRAIGASKKDIKRVFNAETLIIGFVAGFLGIGITYALASIASSIVYTKKGIPNIATLSPKAAGILILISMFLAFISGLIPASSAAKKDPVEALRSE